MGILRAEVFHTWHSWNIRAQNPGHKKNQEERIHCNLKYTWLDLINSFSTFSHCLFFKIFDSLQILVKLSAILRDVYTDNVSVI